MLKELDASVTDSNIDVNSSLNNIENYIIEARNNLEKNQGAISNSGSKKSLDLLNEAEQNLVSAKNATTNTLRMLVDDTMTLLSKAGNNMDKQSSDLEEAENQNNALVTSLSKKMVEKLDATTNTTKSSTKDPIRLTASAGDVSGGKR